MDLQAFFRENPRAALGFSGGVDSRPALVGGGHLRGTGAALLCEDGIPAPVRAGGRQAAVPGAGGGADRHRTGHSGGAPRWRKTPGTGATTARRAHSEIARRAQADGFSLLLDGTNASDDAGDRPGMRAISELSVRSPLRECGLTKDQVRALSREAGLFTWDKPAYACLATRIPTGEAITAEVLEQVERAEDTLFALGYRDFRVRVFHGAARLQLQEDQLQRAACEAGKLRQALGPWFQTVLLDLTPR